MQQKLAQFELHISDVRTFKSCKRRWWWSSPLKGHLEPSVTPLHFMVGRAVHYALATYYESTMARMSEPERPIAHPMKVFDFFMDAAVRDEEQRSGGLWTSELTKFNEGRLLGHAMMNHYYDWVTGEEEPDSRWKQIATELPFSVPILNPYGRPSNRIFLAGRLDGIIEDQQSGMLWIREYKTSARKPNPSWLELDDQSTIYTWAAQQILGRPIAGVQFRFLKKSMPEPPKRLQNGTFSKSKSQDTTYALYEQTLQAEAERTKVPYVDLRSEYDSILELLAQQGSSEYFTDIPVRKTQKELAAAAMDLHQVGLEMTRAHTPDYPEPDWLKCDFCPFRAPCKAKNAGADFEMILKHEYRQRRYEDPVDVQNRIEW